MLRPSFVLSFIVTPLLVVMSSTVTFATPISGEVHFTGTALFKLAGAASDFDSADSIDFSNPIAVEEAISTDDYAGLPAGTTATFTDFTFGTVGTTGALVVSPLWTFTVGLTTYSFDLATVTSNSIIGGARVIEGVGTATISGGLFDPTPGVWQLSSSGRNTTVSFSSYTAVPESGNTAVLVGLALLGIAAINRKLM